MPEESKWLNETRNQTSKNTKSRKSSCCNNEVVIRSEQVKRKVQGSERNSSIEFTKSAEGKREIKCEGNDWWSREEKIPVMSLGVSNKLRGCIVFYNLFSKFSWNRKKTSLDQKSYNLRKKWLFIRKEDFERLKEENLKSNKYFVSKEIKKSIKNFNKDSREVIKKKHIREWICYI